MPFQPNSSHVPGYGRFFVTNTSSGNIPQSVSLNSLFTADETLTIQLEITQMNEVLISKGHVSDPANGSWSILNENKYLKIVFHETNGVNSLVFKSTNQILNTKYRKISAIRFNILTNNLELFLDGNLQLLVLDTSMGHYRTNINQFTGLRTTSDDVLVGRGTGGTDGNFYIYKLLVEEYLKPQPDIANHWNTWKDTRTISGVGVANVIVSSDRGGNGLDVYIVNDDFTDPVLKTGLAPGDMTLPTWSKDWTKDEFTFIHNAGVSNNGRQYVYKEGVGAVNVRNFLNPSQVAYSGEFMDIAVNPGSYNFNLSLGVDSKINTISYGYASQFHYSLMDINNTANSIHYPYEFPETLSGTPIIQTFNSPYVFNTSRKWVESHPINSDIVLLTNRSGNTGICALYTWNRSTNTLSLPIYTTSYSGNDDDIQNVRYSPDGTKIGFNTWLNSPKVNPASFIMDADGSNVVQISSSASFTFSCFSPDGTEVLMNKHDGSYWRTYKKNLTTNVETNLSGNGNYNDLYPDWKA